MKAKPKKKWKRPPAVGILCPTCGKPTAVIYSRPRGAVTFRRRLCRPCGQRFTTAEKIVNRGDSQMLTDKTAMGLAITDLLHSCGLNLSDLQSPVTIPPAQEKLP